MWVSAMAVASSGNPFSPLKRSIMPVIIAWNEGVRGRLGKFDGSVDIGARKVSAYDARGRHIC
jgi:hypothetical protein